MLVNRDGDEAVNDISECSKQAEKACPDGKGDPLRIVTKIKFDHTTKWYMHNLESVRENEKNKIFRDFEILTTRN